MEIESGLWKTEKGTIQGCIDIKNLLELIGNNHHGIICIEVEKNKYKQKNDKRPNCKITLTKKTF
jgi:hypothetical protein